jgi:hypothetical protein
MPNWCNNYIQISGSKENMKPIITFFEEGQKKVDEYYKKKQEIVKEYPEFNMWDEIDGLMLEEQLVMNTLVPHDEDYEKIKESGDFLINPQQRFYGTKWDFDLRESNVDNLCDTSVTISPSTAWSPPTEFCERLAKKYDVDVTLNFDEGGEPMVGREVFNSEGMVEQEFYSGETYIEGLYFLDRETFWSMVDSDLEDLDDITEEEFLKRFSYVCSEDLETIKNDFKLSKVE